MAQLEQCISEDEQKVRRKSELNIDDSDWEGIVYGATISGETGTVADGKYYRFITKDTVQQSDAAEVALVFDITGGIERCWEDFNNNIAAVTGSTVFLGYFEGATTVNNYFNAIVTLTTEQRQKQFTRAFPTFDDV